MNYYIADPHFGHAAVIGMEGRPFADVGEMDRALIENWNARVRAGDDVWIVGDFAYRNERPAADYLRALAGRKHLVVGNHDAKWMKREPEALEMLESVEHIAWLTDGSRRVVLCHYPMLEWPGFWRGSWHVYGHIHSNRPEPYFGLLQTDQYVQALNAGADVNGFMPVTLDEMAACNERWRGVE